MSRSNMLLMFVIIGVVAASGCIQNSSTDLNSEFNTSHQDVELSSSGSELYQTSISQASDVSNYTVYSNNKMAMNLPFISLFVDMDSEGVFEQDGYEVNNSGTMNFKLGGSSNSTEFETRLVSSENTTEVYNRIGDSENSTEVEKYSREKLGVSLKALESVSVENTSVLGETQLEGETSILLELEPNSSNLMRNSEDIFEVHSLIQESSESSQGMEEVGDFEETKAYLWIDQESRVPSKFAYYGSAQDGSLQVRSITQYN